MAGVYHKIEVILIHDFTGLFKRHQLESTISFAKELYIGVSNRQLWMRSMTLYTSKLFPEFTNVEGTFIRNLNRFYTEGTRLPEPRRSLLLYPNALKWVKSYFGEHVGQRFVVLITHSKELCTRFECKDCCNNCGYCGDDACKQRLRARYKALFVSNQADALKKSGVKVITIGVGNKSDPIRLKCWASSDMFISLNKYAELPIRGASIVLNLIKGIKRPVELTSTSTTATTTTTTTSTTTTTTTTTATSTTTATTTTSTTATTASTGTSTVTPVKAVPVRSTSPFKATTMLTSRIVATATTITSRLAMNMTSKHGGYINTLPSTTMTTEAAGQGPGSGLEWYWWILAVAAVFVISFAAALTLIAAVMCWWKREQRSLVPIITKKDSRGPPKLVDKPLGPASYTSAGSLRYGTRTIAIKDPNFVVDPTCSKTTDRFRTSSIWGTGSRRIGISRSTAADFMSTGKASEAITRADPGTALDIRAKSQSTALRPPKMFASTQKVKVSPTGRKEDKEQGFGINRTNQWSQKQKRAYSQSTHRVLPESYAPA